MKKEIKTLKIGWYVWAGICSLWYALVVGIQATLAIDNILTTTDFVIPFTQILEYL